MDFLAKINRLLSSRYLILNYFIAYALVWTVTAAFSDASLHFDIQEEIAWGKEWLIGLYRHPPMKVWLLEISNQMTGFAGWTPYLLSGMLFALGQWAVWRTLADVHSNRFAAVATIATTGVYLFGNTLPLWNANTVQLVFVGFMVFGIWRALDRMDGRWWLLAAAAAAGGTLGKYSFLTMVAPLALWLLADPLARRRIRWGWVGMAIVLYLALIAPTAIWLLTDGREGVAFISGRMSNRFHSVGSHLLAGMETVLIVIGLCIPPLLLFASTRQPAGPGVEDRVDPARRTLLARLLGATVLGSLALIVAISLVTGSRIKDHWLMANMMLAAPCLLVLLRGKQADITVGKWSVALVGTWTVIMLAAYPLERVALLNNPESARSKNGWFPLMPSEPLVRDAEALWAATVRAHPGLAEQPQAIAGTYLAALIANSYDGRPSWLEGYAFELSPWVHPETIRASGLLAVEPVPASFADSLGLCTGGKVEHEWKNVRGVVTTRVTITALIPARFCEETR